MKEKAEPEARERRRGGPWRGRVRGSISEHVTCGQGWSEVSWPSRHLEESLRDRGKKKSKSPEA